MTPSFSTTIGEVTNGTISTTVLAGVAIDEVIARYSQTGNRTYLTDALGSVIAQAKDDQTIQNFYGYSPYGQSTSLGPDEGNPIQFTARENDGTGLLYYRARFYDPVLKRFISEDPIGLAGGPNVYSYVDGAPINLVDPTGNASTCYAAGPDCSGAGSGIIKTPPGGGCQKAIMRGGYIVGWEPCYPTNCPEPGTGGGTTTSTTPSATTPTPPSTTTPTPSGPDGGTTAKNENRIPTPRELGCTFFGTLDTALHVVEEVVVTTVALSSFALASRLIGGAAIGEIAIRAGAAAGNVAIVGTAAFAAGFWFGTYLNCKINGLL